MWNSINNAQFTKLNKSKSEFVQPILHARWRKKLELTVVTIKINLSTTCRWKRKHSHDVDKLRLLSTTHHFCCFRVLLRCFTFFFVDSVDKHVCLSRYIIRYVAWALMPLCCCYGLLLLLYWRIHIIKKSPYECLMQCSLLSLCAFESFEC